MSENMIIPALHTGTHPSLKSSSFSFRIEPFSVRVNELSRIGESHWHDYTQLWYTVSGSYDQVINGERVHMTPGSLALIFPFTTHSIDTSATTPEETRIICISIYEDLFSKNIMPFRPLSYVSSVFDKLLLTPLINLSGKARERMTELFEDCYAEYERHYDMQERKIFNIISNIFELLAISSNSKISDAKLLRAHEQSIVISEAARFIGENAKEAIPLDEIAKLTFMSKRSFNDKFKSCTGQTFYDFYMRSRMVHVIKLLRFSNKSLSEIADECGFYDSVHLSHTIKNMYGLSPAELREQMLLRSVTYGELLHAKRMERIGWMNISDEKIDLFYRGSIGEKVF
ncbi:MAG: helix-turn-helix domain-containing protein [Oscillospiraceae bacterium]|nr:helix-turn-helix domain-containing protein [Oscillospiraceae bacterium]